MGTTKGFDGSNWRADRSISKIPLSARGLYLELLLLFEEEDTYIIETTVENLVDNCRTSRDELLPLLGVLLMISVVKRFCNAHCNATCNALCNAPNSETVTLFSVTHFKEHQKRQKGRIRVHRHRYGVEPPDIDEFLLLDCNALSNRECNATCNGDCNAACNAPVTPPSRACAPLSLNSYSPGNSGLKEGRTLRDETTERLELFEEGNQKTKISESEKPETEKPETVEAQKPKTKKQKRWVRPELEDVKVYFAESEKARIVYGDVAKAAYQFFTYWESNDWERASGVKIKRWKMAAANWISKEEERSQKSGRKKVEEKLKSQTETKTGKDYGW